MKNLKKILSVLTLIVLVGSDFLTSISYALDDLLEDSVVVQTENEEAESVENEEENVDEKDSEDAYEGESIGEENEAGETVESTTGDIVEEGTGEVSEIGSGEIEELTEETVEGATGDIIKELTGEVIESTGTGEETVIEEIKYNEEPIIGEKTYNDVIVRVEALSGIFPEGTELTIKPIKWWNLSSLKDKLVEEKEEIKEDTTIVAFDITFRYEGEEVQPKDGEKVKVTFDYSRNEDLVNADRNENQEVKVYHIDDKTDEGTEIDIVNKDGDEVGILATEFSIYAVIKSNLPDDTITIRYDANGGIFKGGVTTKTVTYTKDANNLYVASENVQAPNKSGKYMFDGWYTDTTYATEWYGVANDTTTTSKTVYARWLPFEDLPAVTASDGTKYILMDRNLGATDVWNYGDSETSAAKNGKYYQWGNNYGFSASNGNGNPYPYTSNMSVDASGYGPGNYYSSATFILIDYRWDDADNPNLWGGNGDTATADGPSTTEEGRQGPCPSGYHVPSTREWKAIYNALGVETNNSGSIATLQKTLHLPKAGGRYNNVNTSVVNNGTVGNYRSSSPNIYGNLGPGHAPVLNFSSSRISSQSDSNCSHGYSVRCFKNSPTYTLTLVPNNGSGNIIVDVYGDTVDEGDIPTITKDGYTFAGWYLTGAESAFDFSGTAITGDITLYAKWLADFVWYETIDDVDVNVNINAKGGTFPEGTELFIELVSQDRHDEIHTALVNDMGKNLELLAFDIYFMSGGVKQQPTTGVLVKLNYEGNPEFQGASLSDLSLYHIDGTTHELKPIEIVSKNGDEIEFWATEFSEYLFVLQEGEYIVSFVSDDVEVGSGIAVSGNVYTGIIPTPTKDGYTFAGWYLTGAESAFNFSGTAITGDITLYAKWQEDEGVTYTVTFDANRGTFADTPADQVITGGYYAEEPQTHPELPGYTFIGWYTAAIGGNKWNFANDPVTENITLYAHWTYNEIFGELDVYMIDSNKNLTKIVMMDRNLGASVRYDRLDFTSPNFSSLGFAYQWGNNWGFTRCADNTLCHGDGTPNPDTISQAVSDWIGHVPSKYASKKFHGKNASNYAGGTWISSNNEDHGNNLWGFETGTPEARQGPCPDGYYLPLGDDYNTLYTKWKDIRGYSKLETNDQIRDFTEDFLFPLAGSHKKGRFYEYDQGLCADYWTISLGATVSENSANNFWFCRDKSNKYSGVGYSNTQVSPRNNGSTVRCFKDSTNANLKIDAKGGKQALITIIKEGNVSTIDTIKEPTKKTADNIDLVFSGWYTTLDYQDGTKKVEGSSLSASDTGLYARWDCPNGLIYDSSNNQCVSLHNVYTVIFENWDGSVLWSGEIVAGETPVYSGSDPSRPVTEQYIYTFDGWYPEITPVTSDVIYTAIYIENPRLYTVTLTGTPAGYGRLSTESLSKEYGAAIVISGNNLTVGGTEVILTGNEGYEFQEWTGTCGKIEKQVCDEFTVYSHPEPIEFTGGNNLIITNEGYDLFSESNYQKDFEISFDIVEQNLSSSESQATILNVKDEDQEDIWPGFVIRKSGTAGKIEISATSDYGEGFQTKSYTLADIHNIKMSRINSILYVSINGGANQEIYDYSGFYNYFTKPIVFGSSYKNSNHLLRPAKITLSNILIKSVDTCYTGNVYVVTGDCQMTAKFTNLTPSEYTVTGSVATGQENMGYLSGMGNTGINLTGLYEYGSELIFIAIPELGYVFDYWKNGDIVLSGTDLGDGTNQLTVVVDQILDIIAFFKPSENTPYTVEHYKQNLDQTGYEFVWSGTMYGTTNGLTNATGTDYEGFSLSGDLASYQTGIKADGSTIVRLYYDRDTYTVTWKNWNNETMSVTNEIYGAHPVFESDGMPQRMRADEEIEYDFIFTGWIRSGTTEIIRDLIELNTEVVTGNVTYIAQYDQRYRYYEVRYNPNGGTGKMENQMFQLNTSGTLVPNTFTKTGFEFRGRSARYIDDFEGFYEDEQTININIYQDVEGDREGTDGALYLNLYAQWKPSTGTKVTVNYYLKDLDKENNKLINSSTGYATGVEFTGITDDIVDILARYGTGIEGYEYSTSIVYGPDYPSGIETGTTTVLADGSRVIDIYYVPSIYQFTLNSEPYSSTAGSSENTGYYYGAKVTLSGDINDDCFTWNGWTTSGITLSNATLNQTWFDMPANDVEATPSTTENTYNIIFNGNGSNSGTMSPMNGIRCTESTGLAINTFEKSGHTFTGWSTTQGGIREYADRATINRLSTGADVNLYAVWDINKFEISANVATGDHGSLQWSGSGIYDFGETLAIIAVPELGYLFDYWEINGETELPEGATTGENQLTIVVNQILDIVAHFTENAKTVTVNYYEMDTGGTYSGVTNSTTFTGLVGYTGYANIDVPYGFHLDTERTANIGIVISDNDAENVISIYYARNKHHITLGYAVAFLNSGSVTVVPTPRESGYYYGEDVHFEAIVSTGYVFKQWRKNGISVGDMDGADFVMGDEDVELVVDGDLINYNIDYYTEPGYSDPLNPNPDSYTILSGDIEIHNPIAEFCNSFLGWTGGTTGDRILSPTTGLVIDASKGGDRKYYASWEWKSYEVALSVDPSSGGTVTGAGTYRCMGTIELHATSNTGYHFEGWYDDGGNLVSSNEMYVFRAPEGSLGTGFTARFAINQYYITIDKNGSGYFQRDSAPSGRYYHGTPITFFASPSYGYKIQKWSKNRQNITTGENDQLYTGFILDVIVTETGNYEVYFEPETYNIIYMDSGSILTGLSPATYTVENQVYSGDLPSITKDGYNFAGWFYEYPWQPENQIQEIGYVPVDGQSVTILAGWMPIDYNINYHLLTGVEIIPWEEYYPYEFYQSYNIETERTNLPEPQKSGYVFSGWVDYHGKSFTGFGGGMTGDLDLYPTWRSDVMDITVNYYEMNTGGVYSGVTNSTTFTGLVGHTGYATVNIPYGFHLDTTQTTSTGIVISDNDSENVIDIYYARNQYQLNKFYTGDFQYNHNLVDFNPKLKQYYYYGEHIYTNVIAHTGYSVNNLTCSGGDNINIHETEIEFDMGDKDATIIIDGSKNRYRIDYYLDGGIENPAEPNVTGYTIIDGSIQIHDPIKTGYNFLGWTGGMSGDWISTPTSGLIIDVENGLGDRQYYANWTGMEYIVTLYVEPETGGTVYGSGVYHYGDLISVWAMTNEGYDFTGWYTYEGYNKISDYYQIGLQADDSGGTGLIAKFELRNYLVHISSTPYKGSSRPQGDNYYQHGSQITVTAEPYEGYNVKNWMVNGRERKTGDNERYTGLTLDMTITDPTNIVIDFEPKPYSITYMSGDTILTGLSPNTYDIETLICDENYIYEYGSSCMHYLPTLTRDGYDFTGWYNNPRISSYDRIKVLSGMGDRTIYAGFIPIIYRVYYHLGSGETLPERYIDSYDEYTIESGRTYFPEPKKQGYDFLGWKNDDNQIITGFGGGMTGNLDLYPIWTGKVMDIEVRYYEMDINGNYNYYTHYDYTGITNSIFNVPDYTHTGFKQDRVNYPDQPTSIVVSGNNEANIIDVYYDREEYEITIGETEHGSVSGETGNQRYGKVITFTAHPEIGYILDKWFKNGEEIEGETENELTLTVEEGMEILGHFIAATGTEYRVEYYYQNAEDGSYPSSATSGETRKGTTDTIAEVMTGDKNPTLSGYSFDSENEKNVLSGNINGSGDLVLKVYFKKQFIVKYLTGDKGLFDIEIYEGLNYSGDTPEFVGNTGDHMPGYTFNGWQPEVSDKVIKDESYVAQWIANTGTEYKVEYYKENLDGGYDIWTGTYSGTTDQEAVAPELIFTGFTYDSGNVNNVTTGNIDGDGGKVLKLYYTRNVNNVVYVYTGKVPSGQVAPAISGYKYETEVSVESAPSVSGYNFSWSTEVSSFIMPDEEVTITGTWTVNTGTKYAVKHMLQNVEDDEYTQTGENQILSGETDELTDAQANSYTGFVAQAVTQTGIRGDESTVVEIYYDREIYEVTTGESEHGSISGETGNQRYGKVITFTAHPEIGYVVSRWLKNGEEIISGGVIWTGEELEIEVNTGMEIGAEFKARDDTLYYVEYYKENLDGGYDIWTGTYSGTTDQEAVAPELIFTGFTYDSGNVDNKTTGNIDGDGSRVLKMYYNRKIYTITWLNEDGTDMDTTTVKYGEVPTHADPTQPADAHYTYKFKGWNPEPTFATGEISYRATYEHIVNKHTITWKNDDGSLIDKTMVEYGTIPTHTKPTKTETEDYRYVFAGWDPEVVAVVGDAEYTAVFNAEKKEKSSKGGGMSGGGGRGGNIDNSDNQHGSAEENIDGSGYTGDEVVEVDDTNKDIVPLYKWTYENNVTTMDTLEDADPDGLLTRGHLAKMVVNYMVNVLGRSMPYDITYNCLYWGDDESSWESDEIRDYATKACAFGVMGINMENNEFLPNNIVTRAEFGTVMSRVLWGDKYDITDTNHRSYFEDHLQALKKDNILTQIANPETRWEIRKWVWLVFRRIVEKYKK